MTGNLSGQLIPQVLRKIHSKSQSGDLSVQRGGTTKTLQFSHGQCIGGHSSDPSESLGELLLRMGKLSPEQLEAATQAVSSSAAALPEALSQMKLFEPQELLDFRTLHVQDIVYSLFNWTSGSYEFKPGRVSDTKGLQLPLPSLIFEGIRRITNSEVVHKGLQGNDRIVRLAANFEAIAAEVFLKPDEAFILSRIESSARIAEILQLSPLGLEMTQKSLYSFLSVGIIEFMQDSRDKEATKTPAATRAYRASSAPTFQPGPAGGEEQLPQEDLESVRSDVFLMLDKAKSQNYYDLLNIPPTASPDEIKKSYYSLAKKYHPDRYHQSAVADLKSALDTIFSTLAQAYDTLKVPATRCSYDAKALRPEPSSGTAAEKPAQGASSGASGTAHQKLAEMNYRQGRGHYEHRDYWSAIQALRQSVRLEPQNARYRYWLGLSLSRNTKWRREAEEHFLKAIELEQFTADHYIGLGQLYKEAGMQKRAENQFRQALQVAPENKAAREALDALLGAQKKETKGLGALKELFKRK